MTIFLHGSDGYRRMQRLRILLEQFLAKYPGTGVRRIDPELDELPYEKALEILGSSSLFSPRTLLVLDGALSFTPAQLKALMAKTGESETLHLILLADTDKVAKTHEAVTKGPAKQEHFPALAGADWATFVVREAKARDLALTKEQLKQLTYAFPGDGWGVATELDVLAAMPEELRPGRIRDTARAVPAGSPSWFELRKLGSGNPALRLGVLERLLATGDAPAKLFAMAAYSASPRAAAEGDLMVKTGGWDHEEALLALALY